MTFIHIEALHFININSKEADILYSPIAFPVIIIDYC